jgi:hypothetical protein
MDKVFLIASKLIWVLVRPAPLLVLFLATGWLLLRVGRAGLGHSISIVSLLSACIIAVFPMGDVVLPTP